jgi:hypothetical protein
MTLSEYAAMTALVLVLAVAAIGAVAVNTNRSIRQTIEQTLGTYKPASGEIDGKAAQR